MPSAETIHEGVVDRDREYIRESRPHPFKEPVVRRVSTRSSTHMKKNAKRPSRKREERKPSSSSDPESPIVNAEKGVDNPFPDVSMEVRRELEENKNVEVEPARRVRFSRETSNIGETSNLGENKPIRVDEYDILQDIKDQKANVTIGQLLHDNANYQKQVREAYIRPRRR
jgi:hypothetical protein